MKSRPIGIFQSPQSREHRSRVVHKVNQRSQTPMRIMRSPLRSHATGDRRWERWGVGDMLAKGKGGDESPAQSMMMAATKNRRHFRQRLCSDFVRGV